MKIIITFNWIKSFKIAEKENKAFKAFIKILEAFQCLNNNEKPFLLEWSFGSSCIKKLTGYL